MAESAAEGARGPEAPDLDAALRAALASLRSSVECLAGFDLERAREMDLQGLVAWRAELRTVRATLNRLFLERGERPPALMSGGHAAVPFSVKRMQVHLRDLAQELSAELQAIGPVTRAGDVTTYQLLGLHFRVVDVFRFFRWLETTLGVETSQLDRTQRLSAIRAVPAPAPAVEPERAPARYDLDLRPFLERPEEISGFVRNGPLAVMHASSPGITPSGREAAVLANRAGVSSPALSLDLTSAFAVRDGLAFTLADGDEASVGARVAVALTTRSFGQLLSTYYSPFADPRAILAQAADWALQHLDSLLRALLQSADDSLAIQAIRGALPTSKARRVLQHTLSPEPELSHIRPALSFSFLGGLVRLNPEQGVYELYLLSIGDSSVEVKVRRKRAERLPLLEVEGPAASLRLSPGPLGRKALSSREVLGPFEVPPGAALLVSSASLRRGHDRTVWEQLADIGTGIDQHEKGAPDHALQILRRACRVAETVNARAKDPLFPGDLSLGLIAVDAGVAGKPPERPKPPGQDYGGLTWSAIGTA